MWRGSRGGPATSSARPKPRWAGGPGQARQGTTRLSGSSSVLLHQEKEDAATGGGWPGPEPPRPAPAQDRDACPRCRRRMRVLLCGPRSGASGAVAASTLHNKPPALLVKQTIQASPSIPSGSHATTRPSSDSRVKASPPSQPRLLRVHALRPAAGLPEVGRRCVVPPFMGGTVYHNRDKLNF